MANQTNPSNTSPSNYTAQQPIGQLKWNRSYLLQVQTQSGDTQEFGPPLTVEFDLVRNNFTSSNIAQFRIYNLGVTTRESIRKDITDYDSLRLINFFGGYNPSGNLNQPQTSSNLPLLFAGNVTTCFSFREGVNFITQIECLDGGFAIVNATGGAAQSFAAGQTQLTVAQSLIGQMPGVSAGYIGSGVFTNTNGQLAQLQRGNAYPGSTWKALTELTGEACFIDRLLVNVLADNEVIADTPATINSNSGLLGTPIREQYYLTFDMILEPRLFIGQQVTLESVIANNNFNGTYKVSAVKHRGIISESVAGTAITSVKLVSPKIGKEFTPVTRQAV